MSILSIARNFNGDPNIVMIVTDDDITDLTTAGYWELDETVESIEALQNGEWQWLSTDLILINYNPGINGFFTFDSVNQNFVINTPYYSGDVAFTPTVTFAVPGDLSVVYTTRTGFYWQVGNLINLRLRVAFTPTYTTSSGIFKIEHPLLVSSSGTLGGTINVQLGSSLVFPAGTTQIFPIPFASADFIGLRGIGDGVTTDLTVTQFPTGVARDFAVYVTFEI